MLSTFDSTKVKTQERVRLELAGELITELTKLSRFIVSPRKEKKITNILFSQTLMHDYEKLCGLVCLGIEKKNEKYDDFI